MDRITSLSVFAKVVEVSSFAAAARHFGLSPAMVSKHVLSLEERLGARLLNRTTRQVSPTEGGRPAVDAQGSSPPQRAALLRRTSAGPSHPRLPRRLY